jgi:hypothetical protein
MTVAEMLSRISSRELSEWAALYRVEDDERKAAEEQEARAARTP